MNTNIQVKEDVAAQLEQEPTLNGHKITVDVKNGVVTLHGVVDSYIQKKAAKQTVMKVRGVQALAEEIQVDIPPAFHKTDTEIAQAVISALKWHTLVPENKVMIKVFPRQPVRYFPQPVLA